MEYEKLKTSSLGISKILVTLILLLTSSCAIYHGYDAYQGKVIDAETKEPLEGAAVLAVYYIKQYGGPGGPVTYYLDAQETLTDKNGEFKIPSNAQLTLRFLGSFDPDPRFTIFKPGYGCYPNHKDAKSSHHDPSKKVSASNLQKWTLPADKAVVVELPRLKTREERKDVGLPTVSGSVPYEKQIKLIELINKEREFLGYPGKIEKKAWDLLKK